MDAPGGEPEKVSRNINFRVAVETHGRLFEVAKALGIDVTSLLNQMVAELLPAYYERAAGLKARRARAEALFDLARQVPSNHPGLHHLLHVGRAAPVKGRLARMAQEVKKLAGGVDHPAAALLEAAERILREEDLTHQVLMALNDADRPPPPREEGTGQSGKRSKKSKKGDEEGGAE